MDPISEKGMGFCFRVGGFGDGEGGGPGEKKKKGSGRLNGRLMSIGKGFSIKKGRDNKKRTFESHGAEDYLALFKEIVQRGKEGI